MKFINNHPSNTHLVTILENLEAYDKAFFATAFLKVSGLKTLIKPLKAFLKSGNQISIVAGQNFALTEPEALHTLRKLFKSYPSSKLYLAKASSANSIFHPKLYLFKSKKTCCVISGSANITEGGLIKNKETSLVAKCNTSDELWIEAKEYFDWLVSPECATEATLLVIKQYETFFEQQKYHNKKSKAIPTKTKSQLAFDYDNLVKHFNRFDNAKRDENFKNKLYNYKEAKKVLDKIVDTPRLTQSQFEPLLDSLVGSKDEFNLWHSGSLFRLRKFVYPYFKQFQDLVRYIRDSKSLPAAIVFKEAKKG